MKNNDKTSAPSRASVKTWMRKMVSDYVDPDTDEVNATALAEGAADEFDAKDLGGWLDDEGHFVWEVAQEVSDEYEKRRKSASVQRVASRFLKATSPEQWEAGAEYIERGAKGEVDRMIRKRLDAIDAAFQNAARQLENHKRFGVGRTESPALLLGPLREMKGLSEFLERLVSGALKAVGESPSNL